MTFYIISANEEETSTKLLKEACVKRKIPCRVLIPDLVCPSDIKIEQGDMVYRVATGANYGAPELERDLLSKGAVSFRRPEDTIFSAKDETIIFRHFNIPTPKTIAYLPKDKDALIRCVEEVGGFPVCLKVLGSSHGAGVMRVDTPASLFSVAGYLRTNGKIVVMKEFCDVTTTARLIVLGDEVIDSIQYIAPKGDFRSNEGESPNVSSKKFNQNIYDVAVKAVQSLRLEFGGVDIMVTKNGPKVAEVNCPCYFPRCQMLTGTDIAGKMVEYLIQKASKQA